jgi:uncharacterized protein YciI
MMQRHEIEAAYAPFVASLRAGGHLEPADGWDAGRIAAHVIASNDTIAEAAEQVAAGEVPSYDNTPAVDGARLAWMADMAGGLAGLADEVERSATRLAEAAAHLGEMSGTEVKVTIHSDGEIVADGPMPISAFVEGNASFHLGMHREQLRALEPERKTEPPTGFESFELVLLRAAPDAPELTENETAALLRQHLGHFTTMHKLGLMKVAGPLRQQPEGSDLAGICIYQTGSVETTRRLAEDDPAIRAGDMVVEVMQWLTPENSISFADPESD